MDRRETDQREGELAALTADIALLASGADFGGLTKPPLARTCAELTDEASALLRNASSLESANDLGLSKG